MTIATVARLGGAAMLLFTTVAAPAAAQTCQTTGAAATCSVNTTTSLTVPTILRLTIGSGTTAFGTISAAAYDLGTAEVPGPSVVVKANQPWRVQLSSTATFWTAVNTDPLNPARTTKPLADLRWGPAVGGSFTPVSGTASQIGAGGPTGGTTVPLAFQSAWSYSLDTPGNYSVSITFTLLSP